ncbi:hypothetical protein PSE10B_28920 [Pseudomonas amygdali pv. eriobotryae]|nr:hypothetical protein PSE10B_28920 [Pseudomonas amygdali pv. eriobotryae]
MKRSGTLIWAGIEFVKTLPFSSRAPDAQTSGARSYAIVENNFGASDKCDIKPLQMVVLSPF